MCTLEPLRLDLPDFFKPLPVPGKYRGKLKPVFFVTVLVINSVITKLKLVYLINCHCSNTRFSDIKESKH